MPKLNRHFSQNLIQVAPAAIVTIIMMFFTIFIFYPGVINADAAYQLKQARLFEFSDWHPPVMSLLWFLLNYIHDGVGIMLIFHNVIFWSALFLLSFWLVPKNTLLRIIFLLAFGFFPPVIGMLGMVFKDTGMAVSLFMASVLLLYAGRMLGRNRLIILLIATVFLFYGFAVRLNAAPAVIVLCVWWGTIFCGKRLMRGMGLGVFLFILLGITNYLVTYKFLHATKTYPWQQVQLHDLAAIAIASKQPVFPEYILTGPHFSWDKLQEKYTPMNVGELLFEKNELLPLTVNGKKLNELNVAWWHGVSKYPREYLHHRLKVFGSLFLSYLAFWDDICRVNLADYNYSHGCIYSGYCVLTVNGPLQFLFHGWIYVANSLIVAFVALWHRKKFQDFKAIMYLLGSGLLYVAGAFLTTPAAEFRYLYWLVIASLFALSLLIRSIWLSKTG